MNILFLLKEQHKRVTPTQQMIHRYFYDDKYWQVLDPSMSFDFESESMKSSLRVKGFEKNGTFNFFLSIVKNDLISENRLFFKSFNGSNDKSIYTIYPGSEPYSMYGKYLLSRELTYHVIIYFMQNGEPSLDVSWIGEDEFESPMEWDDEF